MPETQKNPPDFKAQLKELFRVLEVKRIVVVDDNFKPMPSLEVALAFLTQGHSLGNQDVLTLFGFELDSEIEVIRDSLRDLWNASSSEEQQAIIQKLNPEPAQPEPFDSPEEIRDVFGDLGCEFLPLLPSQWKIQRESLKAAVISGMKTLFLFDQDQTKDNESDTAGEKQLLELISDCPVDYAMCGILSHTFNDEDELSAWETAKNRLNLTEEYANRLVTIAKKRLSEKTIIPRLKLTALAKHITDLKKFADAILHESQVEAFNSLNQINVNDFEHAVLYTSAEDGIWEVDTLFRLFGIYHRHHANKLAYQKPDIQTTVEKLRDIRDAVKPHQKNKPTQAVHKMRRLELYEDAEFLNARYACLDIGDIFKHNDGKHYILIAAQCDIILRADGTRNIKSAMFAPIVIMEQPKSNKITMLFELLSFELPPEHSKPKQYFVDFKNAQAVSLSILDLCSLRNDGHVKMKIEEDTPKPRALLKGLGIIFDKLVKEFRERETVLTSIITNSESNDGLRGMQNELISACLPSLSFDKSFLGSFESNEIDYKLSRVCRLNLVHATALLLSYSRFTSRPAFERDFSS